MTASLRAQSARHRTSAFTLAALGVIACCLGQNCNITVPADAGSSDTNDPTVNQQVLGFTPQKPGSESSETDDSQITKVIEANELDTVVIDFSDQAGAGKSYEWKQLEGPSVTITETGDGVASVSMPSIEENEKAILSFTVTSGGQSSSVLVQINIHDLDSIVNDIDFSYAPLPAVEGVSVDLDVVTLSGGTLPPATYSWDFGDGSVAEGAQVKHTFSAGKWTVALCTAVSAATSPGCTEKQVEVHAKTSNDRSTAGLSIAGFVKLNGSPLAGATVSGGASIVSAVTGADGSYSISVPAPWSGSLTASMVGYTMTPAVIPFSSVQNNQSGKNFAAALVTQASLSLSITGSVQENGTGLAGVTVAASNGGTSATTASNGSFTVRVPGGWSGALSATKSGYTISPGAFNFANVTVNQNGRNFTAIHFNQPPLAEAGADTSVVLDNGSTVSVQLDGSDSADVNGTIVSYIWSEAGNTLGTGPNITVALSLGVHPIQLRVTDDGGASGTDTVVVSVVKRASFYVSLSGNDGWSGTLPSPNAGNTDGPFKTIQHAVTRGQAGTTILVADGLYAEQIVAYNQNGTANAPIILKAIDGAHPIIDATGKPESFGIRLFYSHYWVIEGFEVRGVATGPGIKMEDASGTVIRHVVTHNNQGPGIAINASDDVIVEWNDCYDNGQGIRGGDEDLRLYNPDGSVRFYGTVRCHRTIVRNNMTHDNLSAGGGADGLNVNGTDDALIEYNLSWQNYDDGIDNSAGGAGTNYSLNHTIRYNASWKNGPPQACPPGPNYSACTACPSPLIPETQNGDCGNGAGIKVSTNAGGNNTIHHNIVFQNTLAGFDCDQEQDMGPNRFYNNTAYGNLKGIALDMAGVASANSAAFTINNLLTGSREPGAYGGDLRVSGQYAINTSDYNFIADNIRQAQEGSHSKSGDPKLVNPTAAIDVNYSGNDGIEGKWHYIWNQINANFALQAGSPCRNAGEVLPGVTDGFSGASPDMGAVESNN